MVAMNVGELKELIRDLPDDMRIFQIVGGHKAVPVVIAADFVERHAPGLGFSQFFGEEHMELDSVALKALICE